MVLLRSCCCCIPLKIGCYIVAGYFIVCKIFEIADCKEIFDHLGPEENEDEENRKQKSKVLIIYVIRTLLALVVILVSALVIYATTQKIPIIMKVAACFIAGLETVQFLADVLFFSGASVEWVFEIVRLVLRLYFAAIWYSYGEYIEEGEQTMGYITVYDNTTGQQYQQPFFPDMLHTGQPLHGGYPPSYHYGGRYPGQGAAIYPAVQYPYPPQGAHNHQIMPAPQSHHSVGGAQHPPVKPPAQPTQEQQNPPSNTQMPMPYAPSFWSRN